MVSSRSIRNSIKKKKKQLRWGYQDGSVSKGTFHLRPVIWLRFPRTHDKVGRDYCLHKFSQISAHILDLKINKIEKHLRIPFKC